MPITATFDEDYGFVRVVGTGLPQDYFMYRIEPRLHMYQGRRLPAFDYTNWAPDQIAADYLAPVGERVTYGAKRIGDPFSSAIEQVTIDVPGGHAYIRHLFFPSLGLKVRVIEFNDRRPSRLTTYAISGMRNAMATYDVRNGREGTLMIAIVGKVERDALEETLADGSPISFAMCSALGNEPGIFAVGDVQFDRFGKLDKWIVSLELVEVDMPRVLGVLLPGEIPGTTYDERAAQINNGSYNAAAVKWPRYANAMA